MLTARPLRLWPQTFCSTSPPGAAVREGRCAPAPGLATPRAPRAGGGGTGSWRGLACPHPRPRHHPAAFRTVSARGSATRRRLAGSRNAVTRARRSDWATCEKAVPPRGRSRQGAEPRVRPRAARPELSVPGAQGGNHRGSPGREKLPGSRRSWPTPLTRQRGAWRCKQGLGVPVGIGEPHNGRVAPAASRPHRLSGRMQAPRESSLRRRQTGTRVSVCVHPQMILAAFSETHFQNGMGNQVITCQSLQTN
ncbi:translation initiation factor IF-2-like isoform X2 [Zalophus californianus]|uniref:Translation initiation factor IF-2-like isoform X2 n=1 Tax=Zalophus californianus TaxID=9704 RepID=A0A6J2FLL8_ZALCA|nr:translation initiation factor IF-2-like isoform X2 [Zalophus californianus]